MFYTVEDELFCSFPAFRRGVVVATDVNNSRTNQEVARLLSDAVSRIPEIPSIQEQTRVDVWNAVYRKLGIDPSKTSPSISFLLNQIRRGKTIRSINTLVDLLNLISVRWAIPCGGDDIAALEGGDLRLGFARGDETFAPIFKPASVERPLPREVIYYTPQTRRVLCRRWTWRNSDFSKLTTETRKVVINLDFMIPPVSEMDADLAMTEMSKYIKDFCGGQVKKYLLTADNPGFRTDY
jgi:DNA/RNA-binding domain of Phe-tRNA-synthetase-like protein